MSGTFFDPEADGNGVIVTTVFRSDERQDRAVSSLSFQAAEVACEELTSLAEALGVTHPEGALTQSIARMATDLRRAIVKSKSRANDLAGGARP